MAVAPDAEVPAGETILPAALWVVPVAELGGVARHVLDVARVGIPGFELVVLSPEGPLVREVQALGVRVVVAKFGPAFGLSRSVRALRTAVRLLHPSVVHSHLAYADVVVAAAPLPGGVTRITTEHGIAGDDRVYHGSALKSAVMARVHHFRIARFDGVIAVAEATKGAMLEKWSPKQEIRVIYNGVDAPPQDVERPRQKGAHLRILALARLSPEKRIPQLLRAFAKVVAVRPEARLTIAGVGELEAELKALSTELGLGPSVDFPGFVDAESAMAEADVLAQLSVWENCSYSLLDAAQRGLRVVASRVGGNPEILSKRSLVDADDIDAVASALLDHEARTSLLNWPTVRAMTESIAEAYCDAGARDSSRALPAAVTLATNNGDLGGGEIMLLRLADALRSLSVDVLIVAPTQPSGVVSAARARGHDVVSLEASSRREWMFQLRRWDREHRRGLLWANGLVPAVATFGRRNRVVHLHQLPRSASQRVLVGIAQVGARGVIVPSRWMQRQVPGSIVLPNWSERVEAARRIRSADSPTVLGFLGRPSIAKGVDVLASALEQLEAASPGAFRLRLGGEPHFVSDEEQAAVRRALQPVGHLVEELGWVDPESFFGQIDVLVVPSTWPETFGLVVVEAMSAGVPVIVSDAGALSEVAGGCGTVFRAGDPKSLADAVLSVHARTEAGESDQAGSRRWSSRYSPEAGKRRLHARLLTL